MLKHSSPTSTHLPFICVPMNDMGLYQILCLLCFLSFMRPPLPFGSSSSFPLSTSQLCPHDQLNALLQFKNSLAINIVASNYSCDSSPGVTSYPKMDSWNESLDCCLWDGVTCDNVTRNIIGLDLSCSWLHGSLTSNSSLFSLHHLQSLNLAFNDFQDSPILSSLSVFTEMTHLNFSGSLFSGSIPIEISYLSKLVTLDLSSNSLTITDSSINMLAQNLTELRQLVLDEVDMSMVSPSSFLNLSSSLRYLRASGCSLNGGFSDHIFQLPNLIHLDLSYNYISGILPKSNWSGPLVHLSLSSTSFSGEIPDTIGNMKNLRYLDLSSCKFKGSIATSVGNLTHITTLHLEDNEFTGIIEFDMFAKLKSLEVLSLSGEISMAYDSLNYTFPRLEILHLTACNLTKFPHFLNFSKGLIDLDLSKNMIGGEIPMWFWGIAIDTLKSLDLSSNLLRGGIKRLPWKRISSIDLSGNSLQGPLPILPPSPFIWSLDLSYNGFTGEIPFLICSLSSLKKLGLGNNNLSGSIPPCFGNLTDLMELYLGGNKLEGPLPRSLVHCTTLISLSLANNELSDIFPDWLQVSGLDALDLRLNKFYGRINLTAFEWSFPFLQYFDVSRNNFSGRWPIEFFSHTVLVDIDLSNNNFDGLLPLPSTYTEFYQVANNNMAGGIPSIICNYTLLKVLDLSDNNLRGVMPRCLTNFSEDLWVLNLRNNNLHGTIPQLFSFKNSLSTIDMSHNQIEGALPRMLTNCKNLEVLDLGHNKIRDSFPDWLGAHQKLKVLVLRFNNFKGLVNISMTAHAFPNLHILDISNNFFHGPIPANLFVNLKSMINAKEGKNESLYMRKNDTAKLYEDSVTVTMKGQEIRLVKILTVFTTIDLSTNSFEGNIPEEIGHLQTLKGLNLSHNHFTGSIPLSLGRLTDVEWLDLSSNKLGGEIPKELTNLIFLEYLNLSENQLIGRIPQGKQWSTFSNESFAGNLGLCGPPLSKACPSDAPPPQPSSTVNQEEGTGYESWFEWKFVCMGFVSGFVVGISLGYITLEIGKPKWVARMVGRWRAKWLNKPRRSDEGIRFGR